MRRLAIAALVPLLLLTLTPVVWVFVRSLEIAEQVARPLPVDGVLPEGAEAAELVRLEDDPAGGTVARVDLAAEHAVEVETWQVAQLREINGAAGFAPGTRVWFKRRRDGSGDVWVEGNLPKGAAMVGMRSGTVRAIGADTAGRTTLVIDESLPRTARWEGDPAAAGARVMIRTETHYGIGHYWDVLSGQREWGLLFKSAGLAVSVALVAFLLGFPLGVLSARSDLPGRRWLSAVYVAPLLIPPYVAAIGWIRLAGANGLLTRAVRGGISDPTAGPLLPVYGFTGSVLVLSLAWFPIVTLLTRVALARADRSADEAGALVCSPHRVLWTLVAPRALAAAGAGAAFVFLFALSAYGAPSLLRFVVFSGDVFASFQSPAQVSQAAATATPLVIVATLALLFLGWCERKRVSAPVAHSGPALPLPLGGWRWPAAAAAWALVGVAVLVPLGGLLWQTGGAAAFGEAMRDMRGEFRHSFLTSLGTALGCVAVAMPLGWLLARGKWREGGLIDLLLLLPFAFPAAVLAAGMIELWVSGPLSVVYGTPAYLSLAIAIRTLPFAVRPVAVAARSIPRDSIEAAHLSGASGWQRAWSLWLPLIGPGVASGALLVFILALSDLDTTLLARTPGWETLQVRIFNAIHFGREEVVCAACVLLIGLCTVPVAIYGLAMARKPRVV
ncbi:MAG: ABC transporter permease [Planctomycetota bacterium]|jgi:iron(III) transport system permease protein